jgi:uncharacterized C2H2 Zn-finger protein
MKTFRAILVRLVNPLPGDAGTTYTVPDKASSMLINPESRSAFIVTIRGKEFTAAYDQAELETGELSRMLEVHKCPKCDQVFESAQGLGKHVLIHEPPKSEPEPSREQMQRLTQSSQQKQNRR